MRKPFLTTCVLLSLLSLLPAPGATEDEGRMEIRPVLLVMDVQNIWLPMMAEGGKTSASETIDEAINLFRQSGHPVVAVYHSDPKRGPQPGTEPFRFAEWVAVTADDAVIVKSHPSAFTKTALDSLLKDTDRNTVFLCGLSATGCVLATYFGAMDRDYLSFMIEGALLSPDSSYTVVIEDICQSVSIRELADVLQGRY